jgi:hypothetical protein
MASLLLISPYRQLCDDDDNGDDDDDHEDDDGDVCMSNPAVQLLMCPSK